MFNAWLAVGGVMSLGAALLHLAIIIGGPNWYRYFGAGEEVARMAAEGRWRPAIITGLVAIGLALCGLYAPFGGWLCSVTASARFCAMRRCWCLHAARIGLSGSKGHEFASEYTVFSVEFDNLPHRRRGALNRAGANQGGNLA